jgi:leader peptidase (prepilin peptidase)/N-methyltransferase
VEGITGLLFLSLSIRFGWTAVGLIYAALGAGLILVSVVDARTMEIPNEVTLPGLGLGLLLSILFPALHGVSSRWEGWWASLLGVGAGAGVIIGIGMAGKWFFRRKLKAIGETEAIGGGDVRLMAMVGALIGAYKVLLVNLLLAPLLGTGVGIIMKVRYGRDLIPYGPFLAIGTLMAIFWGDRLLHGYLSAIRF